MQHSPSSRFLLERPSYPPFQLQNRLQTVFKPNFIPCDDLRNCPLNLSRLHAQCNLLESFHVAHATRPSAGATTRYCTFFQFASDSLFSANPSLSFLEIVEAISRPPLLQWSGGLQQPGIMYYLSGVYLNIYFPTKLISSRIEHLCSFLGGTLFYLAIGESILYSEEVFCMDQAMVYNGTQSSHFHTSLSYLIITTVLSLHSPC